MAYQPSWVSQSQIHPIRKVVLLFYPGGYDKGVHNFRKSESENNCKSSKGKVIASLEFELTYYEAKVLYVNY